MNAPLLDIRNLTTRFHTDEGPVTAVENLSLSIHPGQILGMVGESGSGKTVAAMSVLRLIPSPPGEIASGQILFDNRDLLRLPLNELRAVRGRRIGMIFQEPMTALSPLFRIGDQLIEALRFHFPHSKQAARAIALDWLGRVGIPEPAVRFYAYPHELSGGMRQRVMIAMTLMLEPDLIIADEPTTSLDVTIQAQILDLMRGMLRPGAALLLITHDMAIIREMCTHVAVLYAAQLVETGTVQEVFANPLHPYTKALLAAIPSLSRGAERLPTIPGQVPSPLAYPPGCRFAERCPRCFEPCATQPPQLQNIYGRSVACHLYPQNG